MAIDTYGGLGIEQRLRSGRSSHSVYSIMLRMQKIGKRNSNVHGGAFGIWQLKEPPSTAAA